MPASQGSAVIVQSYMGTKVLANVGCNLRKETESGGQGAPVHNQVTSLPACDCQGESISAQRNNLAEQACCSTTDDLNSRPSTACPPEDKNPPRGSHHKHGPIMTKTGTKPKGRCIGLSDTMFEHPRRSSSHIHFTPPIITRVEATRHESQAITRHLDNAANTTIP